MLGLAADVMWGCGLNRLRYGMPVPDDQTLQVRDTFAPPADARPDAQAVIDRLSYVPARFTATVHHDAQNTVDAVVRFPSPKPLGDAHSDVAVLDWYAARDAKGNLVDGPAMLVLDILHGGNVVSGFVARALARSGVHGIVLHMPHNGRRRLDPTAAYDWSRFLPSLRQAIADARRARDVIAALPGVNGKIGIQGTSLGGFIATVAASLDGAFDPVVVLLAGGDVYKVLTEGRADAARIRRELTAIGYDDNQLREELAISEPLRVAHRLKAARTWLYSARRDQVVPRAYGRALARAIGVKPSHHVMVAGCHYSCALTAPWLMSRMIRTVRSALGVTTPAPHPLGWAAKAFTILRVFERATPVSEPA